MEVNYCSKCSKMIPFGGLDDGYYFLLDGEPVCADCYRTLPTEEMVRATPTGGKPARDETRSLRPTTDVLAAYRAARREEPIPDDADRPPAIASRWPFWLPVLIGLCLCAGVYLFMRYGGRGTLPDEPDAVSPAAPEPSRLGTARPPSRPKRPTVTPDRGLPVVEVAATDDMAAEPSDPGTFTITRSGKLDAPLTVKYDLLPAANAAQEGVDYEKLPHLVTIPAGEVRATVIIVPMDDEEAEGRERVLLSIARDDAYWHDVASKTIYIYDDEEPSVSIEASEKTANEAGLVPAAFTIRCLPAPKKPTSVTLKISGEATPGVDYEALPATVTVPAGEATYKVAVKPIGDEEKELAESVAVTVERGTGYNVSMPGHATVYIKSDD